MYCNSFEIWTENLFFSLVYRSPAFKHSSPEFDTFRAENATFLQVLIHILSFGGPMVTLILKAGKLMIFFSLNLSQIISEPTNFEPGKKPSCIDLVVTDQPNFVLDSGTRASLDSNCHHQIIHCKVNFRIPPPPRFERKMWNYKKANTAAIQRSMSNFPWLQHFNLNPDPNWQVKTFTEIFLNIMSNFIPNENETIIPRDLPWITKPLKTMLKRKNRQKYTKNIAKRKKTKLDLRLIGLNDPGTSQKSYWKIIYGVMIRCRAPKIPPLLVDNVFVLNCVEKAKLFNDFFSKQCTPIMNSSFYPHLIFLLIKESITFLYKTKKLSHYLEI